MKQMYNFCIFVITLNVCAMLVIATETERNCDMGIYFFGGEGGWLGNNLVYPLTFFMPHSRATEEKAVVSAKRSDIMIVHLT